MQCDFRSAQDRVTWNIPRGSEAPDGSAQRPGKRRSRLAALALGLTVIAAGIATPAAADGEISARYDLSLAGIPLAKFYVNAVFRGDDYRIGGNMKTSKLVQIISEIFGESKAAGIIRAGSAVPEKFDMAFVWGGERTDVKMEFNGRGIEEFEISPPPEEGSGRVPLKKEHKDGAIDPFSATLMLLPNGEASGESACNRKLPIFDGKYRYDLDLTFKRMDQADNNPMYVCKVKYVPIAGHKPYRKQTKFWAESEDIEIWLSRITGTDILAPYRAELPTPIGTAILSINRFSYRPIQTSAELEKQPD